MADSFPSRLIDSVNGQTGIVVIQEDRYFVFEQGTPATEWTVNHGLGKFPSVTVVDSAGTEIECEVYHQDENTVVLSFNGGFSGKAIFN